MQKSELRQKNTNIKVEPFKEGIKMGIIIPPKSVKKECKQAKQNKQNKGVES